MGTLLRLTGEGVVPPAAMRAASLARIRDARVAGATSTGSVS
jgi:hypothetical protein